MKTKWPVLSIVVLSVAAIIIITVIEHTSSLPGRRPSNPFAFDVEKFKSVDPEMVQWQELLQVSLETENPRDIFYTGGRLYLATEKELQIIGSDWSRILRKELPYEPTSLTVSEDGQIVVAMQNRIMVLDSQGETIAESNAGDQVNITSLATFHGRIYAADAPGRRVLVFNTQLEQKDQFVGESGVSEIHGFIVPGGHFHLAVNPENQLWITNPGIHALQNYTTSGRLRSYIQRTSFDIDGFSGCCNPVYFTFLPDSRFVTSEKGIIRIKVVRESGETESVVAPSELFEGGTRAPAVAVDSNGNIIALDFDRKMIRVFEPI